jgi:hypothetical protein
MPKPKSPPKPAPSKDDPPPKKKLPASIVNAAPTTVKILQTVSAAAKMVTQLEKEMARAKKGGSISLARAFVALHRLNARVGEELEPLVNLFKKYKELEVPATFEADKITHVPLEEGFRVGLSSRLFASIPAGKREQAYQWLRDNGLGDLITATVNAGTLSAAAKEMMEEKNEELPKELFTVALVPNTSVTATN